MHRHGLILGLASLLPALTLAAPAHEHGAAGLDIALDGIAMAITLRGAGDGLVGFEHAADTDDRRATVAAAVATLSRGEALFDFAAGRCTQVSAKVLPPASAKADRDRADDHHSDEHQADKGHADAHAARHTDGDHAHSKHPKHADEAEHGERVDVHENAHAEHADWQADWRFECADASAIAAVRVRLFDAFPRLHELRVQFISSALQTSAVLTPAGPTLSVAPPQ